MSKPLNTGDMENDAIAHKIFNKFKDANMRGMNEDLRFQVDRLLEIARSESPNDPMMFIAHLDKAVPLNYPMGPDKTRLGQVLAAAEMIVKHAKKRREAAAEAFKEQQQQSMQEKE